MPDIIHTLPDSVANQIAAGEVIQRPASLIKELVENSVDAGATRVSVVVENAGKDLVQVIDDGKGMSPTDARLAFERHATSKISSAADLFSLCTMGFRGEALASIAAVAQVELTTRCADDALGTRIKIEGSRVVEQQAATCPVGSNFSVRNLFFNIPVRRKFLKSNQTELTQIIAEFQRMALAHPSVAFLLYSDGDELLNLPSSNFRGRIEGLFGRKLAQSLLALEVDTPLVKITGYVGTPEAARRRQPHQFLFVGERFMRHPYFSRAILAPYERLIQEGTQPPFFLNFSVAPDRIDVNIHPQKTEIKFEDEAAIFQILLSAVREALGRSGAVPTIDFDTAERPEIPAYNPQNVHVQMPKLDIDPSYNPFHSSSMPQTDFSSPAQLASAVVSVVKDVEQEESKLLESPASLFLQFSGRYVVTPMNGGIVILDAHRAHVRILYEKYLQVASQADRPAIRQAMLFPEELTLSPIERATLVSLLPHLQQAGFDIELNDRQQYQITAQPAGTERTNAAYLVNEILQAAADGEVAAPEETIRMLIARTMALRTAIPSIGRTLTREEMSSLFDALFATTQPLRTPDGKCTHIFLSDEEIKQKFN